jgi:RNA polymerase sigma factor (sigma-70 family)
VKADLVLTEEQRRTLAEVNELARLRGTPQYQRKAEAFVRKHRKLALDQANKYRRRGIEQSELDAAALLGFAEALARWDPARARVFSTFVVHWVRNAIQTYLREQAPLVRIPGYWHRLGWRVAQADKELRAAHARAPTDAELCEAAGVNAKQLAQLRKMDLRQVAGLRLQNDEQTERGQTRTAGVLVRLLGRERSSACLQAEPRLEGEEAMLERIEPTESPAAAAMERLQNRPDLQRKLRQLGRGGVEAAMARIRRDPSLQRELGDLCGSTARALLPALGPLLRPACEPAAMVRPAAANS